MSFRYAIVLLFLFLQFMVLPCGAQGPPLPSTSTDNAASGPSGDKSTAQADYRTQAPNKAGTRSSDAVPDGNAIEPADDRRFYAYLEEISPEQFFGSNAVSKGKHVWFAHSAHPMLPWRVWANKHQRFLPSLLFVLFFALINWSVIPDRLRQAETPVRTRFWSTLFIGYLVGAVVITIVGTGLRTLIGWPFAIVSIGVYQLVMLAGLSLLVSMMGRSVGHLLRLQNWPVLSKREGSRRFTELLIGSIIVALILQIPPIGILPRIGTRLAGLMATLGLGGLYRSRAVKPS